MLETAIHNSAQKLRLEHEILEVGRVNAYVVTPIDRSVKVVSMPQPRLHKRKEKWEND